MLCCVYCFCLGLTGYKFICDLFIHSCLIQRVFASNNSRNPPRFEVHRCCGPHTLTSSHRYDSVTFMGHDSRAAQPRHQNRGSWLQLGTRAACSAVRRHSANAQMCEGPHVANVKMCECPNGYVPFVMNHQKCPPK